MIQHWGFFLAVLSKSGKLYQYKILSPFIFHTDVCILSGIFIKREAQGQKIQPV